ncbi:MAG: hypothetical protein ABJC98_15855 [Bacteroidota bacterium]
MEKIDELALQNYPSKPSLVIYATIIYFSDYTKKALAARNVEKITQYFGLAENLYLHGDKIVRAYSKIALFLELLLLYHTI